MSNIENRLAEIIGNHVVDNGFELNKDVAALCQCVSYLKIQINCMKQDTDDATQIEHIDSVIENATKILNHE